jgi:maleylacetate reductase
MVTSTNPFFRIPLSRVAGDCEEIMKAATEQMRTTPHEGFGQRPIMFHHETLAQRVLFGTGKAAENLQAEVLRLGASKVMVIASEVELPMAQDVAGQIEVALWHTEVTQHVPVEVADRARGAASSAGVDLVVCVGGGSTTGLAKAIALTTGIPIVAVPTTYAGSEATNVWGLTEANRKTTGVDPKVLPATVIYDAALTFSLPAGLSVASGLNGMAHCVDSLWAPRANPINAAIAAEGIRALTAGLPAVTRDPSGIVGREQALYGAYLAAVAFASAGSGMHHKICHVLGGTYNLPHAQTHAIMLPYILAFNAPAAPEAAVRAAAAFGSAGLHDAGTAADAVAGLNRLREELAAPRALKDWGMERSDIPEAVDLMLPVIPDSNPRQVSAEALKDLLEAAWFGATPSL